MQSKDFWINIEKVNAFTLLIAIAASLPGCLNNNGKIGTSSYLAEIEIVPGEFPTPICAFQKNPGESGGYRIYKPFELNESSATWTKDEALEHAYQFLEKNFVFKRDVYAVDTIHPLVAKNGNVGWSVCLLQEYRGARFRNKPECEDGDSDASVIFRGKSVTGIFHCWNIIREHGSPRPIITKVKAIEIANGKWTSSSKNIGLIGKIDECVLVYAPKTGDLNRRVPVWCIQRSITIPGNTRAENENCLERIVLDAWTGNVSATGTNMIPRFYTHPANKTSADHNNNNANGSLKENKD